MSNTNSETGRFNNQLLVELYKTRFRAIAYKMSAYEDIEGAKLIASETFHTIYDKCEKGELIFNTIDEGYAYWLKSATNKAYNQYATKTERLGSPHLLSKDDLDFASTEDFRIVVEELKKMLQGLDEKYRLVLTYRFLEGMRSKEIAELMGLSPEVVRQRQSRGLRMLRQNLKDNPNRQQMMGDYLYKLLLLLILHQQVEINQPDPVTNRPFSLFSNIVTTSRENEQV
ncbi:RNA polymerase sigma factor [Pseudoflavitalea rhizosphaerae]|uniref:RNA polymerase sigma factor n=1 Tax=Pseudoflavitalea rhizosphaerae TaxID=1884793 RepID=UPI000F8CD536|nr:sigma-70 family RNA polymerase sigma factor [Pseudoflavitalea rhizosphaerae]